MLYEADLPRGERLPRERAAGSLLGEDSLSGKQAQLDMIGGILSKFMKGDWLAYKGRVSPQFRARVEAPADSLQSNSLVWDLMSEFASVLSANGILPGINAERRYLAIQRTPWMMPLANDSERRFVLRVYTNYVDELKSRGLLASDQLINDYLNWLETFGWNLRREKEGYDLIFIDELHLFGEQERLVFHYLTRSANEYPKLFMALDPRQSPNEVYAGFYGGYPSLQRSTRNEASTARYGGRRQSHSRGRRAADLSVARASKLHLSTPRTAPQAHSSPSTGARFVTHMHAPKTAPPQLAVATSELRERPTFRELADVLLSSGEDARTGPGARSIAAGVNLVHVRPGHAPPVEDAGGTGPR